MERSKCGRPLVISILLAWIMMSADGEPALGGGYVISIKTSDVSRAGTDAKVFIKLFGTKNESGWYRLPTTPADLEIGSLNNYTMLADVGDIPKIEIKHDNTGTNPDWHLEYVEIEDYNRRPPAWRYRFPCRCWLDDVRGRVIRRQGGFLSQPQMKSGCPGGNVTFACAFDPAAFRDRGKSSILWTKIDDAGADQIVAVNNQTPQPCCTVLVNLSAAISDLTVNVKTREDAGRYQCGVTVDGNPTQLNTLIVPDYCFTTTPEATTTTTVAAGSSGKARPENKLYSTAIATLVVLVYYLRPTSIP